MSGKENKDHYEYWNKNRDFKSKYVPTNREKISLRMLSRIMRPGDSFLDLGCGYGRFMTAVSKRFPNIKISGLDDSKSEVSEAVRSGLKVKQANLNEKIPLKSDSCGIVFSGEVIEHLNNPDLFLRECNRILKKGGYLVLTTPNLCAWYNRILMLFGVQPLFLEPSTESKLIGAGFIKKFKKESEPVGHIRIFTCAALKDLLEKEGFRVLDVRGAIFDQGFPKKALFLDRMFTPLPNLSSILVISAKKVN